MTPKIGPDWLNRKLETDGFILLDGAMGSELQRRGVPMDNLAWSGAAAMTHPQVVRGIHEDYIRAGADVIIVNSFSAGRHSLEPAGYGAQTVTINQQAVRLARDARQAAADRPVAIAGSLCEWVPKEGSPWSQADALSQALTEQARILAEEGVDFLILEMCQRLAHGKLAFAAARATGLPVWVGCTCRRVPEQENLRTFDRDTDPDFERLVAGMAALGPDLMAVMHSPIADTDEGLDVVRRYWPGPLAVYPESGAFVMPNWQFVDIIPPDDLVPIARGWLERGVSVIGGCCGLGPDHIRSLHKSLR